MAYQYTNPTERGYQKFKVTRKEHNEILPHRKRNIFSTVEAYYKENNIVLEYTTSRLGKIYLLLLFPLNVILSGLSNMKDIWEEYTSLFQEKKKGKFVSEHISKTKFNGDPNEKFLLFEDIYHNHEVKKHILWVTTEDELGGYSSRWHGWSSELTFSYNDAVKEKEKIKDQFYAVEILEIDEIKER